MTLLDNYKMIYSKDAMILPDLASTRCSDALVLPDASTRCKDAMMVPDSKYRMQRQPDATSQLVQNAKLP
jgi:hypothetical protein